MCFGLSAQLPTPETVLNNSIQFHDPNANWGKAPLTLNLKETRPKGPDRRTKIEIDLLAQKFALNQNRGENKIVRVVIENKCSHQLNGKENLTEAEVKEHRLDCARSKSMRDYYTYLWGLPMKLKDPGTILAPKVSLDTYQNINCYVLKVTYNPEVGKDVWYFYFNQKDYALVGYKFYHEESKNDGEYITLEGMETVNGIQLPKTRKWYTNKEKRFLGADILDAGH